MKTINIVIKSEQENTETRLEDQKTSCFSDLPGFLRDRVFPDSDNRKIFSDNACLKLSIENENIYLVFNDEKKALSTAQTLQLNNFIMEFIPDNPLTELKNVEVLTLPKENKLLVARESSSQVIPKMSNQHYTLIDDHFSPPIIAQHKAIVSVGHHEDNLFTKRDILTDLGFNEVKETDLRKTINFLDYCYEKGKLPKPLDHAI